MQKIQIRIVSMIVSPRPNTEGRLSMHHLWMINDVVLDQGIMDVEVSAPAMEVSLATITYNPRLIRDEVRKMFQQFV